VRGLRVSGCVVFLIAATAPAAGQRAFWQGPLPDRAARSEQAAEWLRGFTNLDQQVPTLSPSEAAWLKREYDDQLAGGVYTPRALSATKSREYNVRVVRQHLGVVLPILKSLAGQKPLGAQDEVREWAELAAQIMELTFWQSVTDLIERGDVRPEINGVKSLHLENHVGWARVILNRIVVPYLEGRLK